MQKTVVGVLMTVTALAIGHAQAAPAAPQNLAAALQTSSYAEQLQPIPSALALLQAEPGRTSAAQLVDDDHHPHHRRRHRTHHARPPYHHDSPQA